MDNSPFNNLSGELHNRIYEFSLIRPKEKIDLSEPALLVTSRQTRLEASPIFYSCNTFQVVIEGSVTRPLRKWLKNKHAASKDSYKPLRSIQSLEIVVRKHIGIYDLSRGWAFDDHWERLDT